MWKPTNPPTPTPTPSPKPQQRTFTPPAEPVNPPRPSSAQLGTQEQATLRACYDFLLRVQSRLRIVHNRSLDQLPENADDLAKLARRMGLESGERLLAELERIWKQVRELFLELMRRDRFTRGGETS